MHQPNNTAYQHAHCPVTLVINGQQHHLSIEPWMTLLDLLLGPLQRSGSKKYCDHGQCGACVR